METSLMILVPSRISVLQLGHLGGPILHNCFRKQLSWNQ